VAGAWNLVRQMDVHLKGTESDGNVGDAGGLIGDLWVLLREGGDGDAAVHCDCPRSSLSSHLPFPLLFLLSQPSFFQW
jgi:hypothetical protein